MDAYTRECLALEVDTSFASRRVTRVLDAIVAERGQPLAIRCDNGPELTSRHFLAWCVERQILVHIQPGKPTQSAHVESFHGRLREECLNVNVRASTRLTKRQDCEFPCNSQVAMPGCDSYRAPTFRVMQKKKRKSAQMSLLRNTRRPR